MKALSVNPEYVIDIYEGKKKEEYRTWSTDHRGDLLICCTATKQSHGFAAIVVSVDDCEKRGDFFAWKLSKIRAIRPFAVKGQQRLFEVESELEYIDGDNEQLVAKIYDEEMPKLLKKPERREK